MNRNIPPWLSPPAIVQPLVRRTRLELMEEAIADSVRHAVSVLGIEALMATSMFPNSSRRIQAKREAEARAAAEQADVR